MTRPARIRRPRKKAKMYVNGKIGTLSAKMKILKGSHGYRLCTLCGKRVFSTRYSFRNHFENCESRKIAGLAFKREWREQTIRANMSRKDWWK